MNFPKHVGPSRKVRSVFSRFGLEIKSMLLTPIDLPGQLALSLHPRLVFIHHHWIVPNYRFSCQGMRVIFHVLLLLMMGMDILIVRMKQVELLRIGAHGFSQSVDVPTKGCTT